MAKRKVWEILESRMTSLSVEFSQIRTQLGRLRERCSHPRKTKLAKGWRCMDCGETSD